MQNLTPAANVQAAALAGVIITVLEDVLARHGVTLTPDVANGLTAFAAVLVAHVWDVITGENVTPTKESDNGTQKLVNNPVGSSSGVGSNNSAQQSAGDTAKK